MAVIRDLNELEPSFFQQELDGGRARVEGVLNELFDSVRRTVNDLRSQSCSSRVVAGGQDGRYFVCTG